MFRRKMAVDEKVVEKMVHKMCPENENYNYYRISNKVYHFFCIQSHKPAKLVNKF